MQNIKTIVDELAILGKKMDDEDVVDIILNGLIHARDNPISFSDLHEKLINHELSLAQQIAPSGIYQPSSVFYVQNRNGENHGKINKDMPWQDLIFNPLTTGKEEQPLESSPHRRPLLGIGYSLANANGVTKGVTHLPIVHPLKRTGTRTFHYSRARSHGECMSWALPYHLLLQPSLCKEPTL